MNKYPENHYDCLFEYYLKFKVLFVNQKSKIVNLFSLFPEKPLIHIFRHRKENRPK